METIEIPDNRVDEIEPLWRELNIHHYERSTHFKEHFLSLTFAERLKQLRMKDQFKIFAAREDAEFVGYCIASLDCGCGEIDSLYIKPRFRGASVGMSLMTSALSWLSGSNCRHITVSVAEGNEKAIPFYETLGFKKRFHVLQIKASLYG